MLLAQSMFEQLRSFIVAESQYLTGDKCRRRFLLRLPARKSSNSFRGQENVEDLVQRFPTPERLTGS
jgi:hypothetical protein